MKEETVVLDIAKLYELGVISMDEARDEWIHISHNQPYPKEYDLNEIVSESLAVNARAEDQKLAESMHQGPEHKHRTLGEHMELERQEELDLEPRCPSCGFPMAEFSAHASYCTNCRSSFTEKGLKL